MKKERKLSLKVISLFAALIGALSVTGVALASPPKTATVLKAILITTQATLPKTKIIIPTQKKTVRLKITLQKPTLKN